MFCTECGESLLSGAKFCQNCGTRVSLEGVERPPAPSNGSPVDRALSGRPDDVERAKQEIIEAVDTESMRTCARRALIAGDSATADFWYVEWVTAPGISIDEASTSILEYTEKVLVPQKRFSEAELYLAWVAGMGSSDDRKTASSMLQTTHQFRGASGLKRSRCGDEWRTVDVSLPLDPNWSPDMQHRRTIAWLEAKSEEGTIDALADTGHPQHLSYVAGFLMGLRDNAQKTGSNFEAQVQGLTDWISFRVGEREALASRAVTASTPKPTPQPKAPSPPPAPKTNELGAHVDRLFSDGKMAVAVKAALGATSGVNDDFIVAAIPVTSKLGDFEDSNNYMVFTRDRVAIVKKGGMFSAGESQCFQKESIAYVGVGESDHYEGQGFGGRTTYWLSLTIQLHSGQSYSRHYYLGRNENEVNSNIPFIRGAFERMGMVGYVTDSGPAWTSSGGYHRTFSYGFGVWH